LEALSAENKQLFGQLINDHIEKLNDLMSLSSGQRIDESSIMKVCLTTKLLEGSVSMLGLKVWSQTMGMFRGLLEKSARVGRRWDEQLSQIVSEILETEEQVIAEILTGDMEGINEAEIFERLQREIDFLLVEWQESTDIAEEAEKDETVSIETVGIVEEASERFSTLERLIESLNRLRDQFTMYLRDTNGGKNIIDDLGSTFGESEFYIGLMGDIISRLGDRDHMFLSTVSSKVVLDGVQDFFNLYSKRRSWNAELVTRSYDFYIDQEVASALAVVLESCLFDVCKMYEGKNDFNLVVDVDINCEGTYLVTKIMDNGQEFLCDSEIDREDVVAFYHGLRSIRSLLERYGGLLWVEPNRGTRGRFQFTLPCTTRKTDYYIFSASDKQVAIPCHCVEKVMSVEDTDIQEDNNGRHVSMGDIRVPVYALDELAAEETKEGGSHDRVMITGIAEKRVGILIDGEEKKLEGIIDQVTEGDWSSLARTVLHVGQDEFPILDVLLMLRRIHFLHGYEGLLEETGTFVGDVYEGGDSEEMTVPRV